MEINLDMEIEVNEGYYEMEMENTIETLSNLHDEMLDTEGPFTNSFSKAWFGI